MLSLMVSFSGPRTLDLNHTAFLYDSVEAGRVTLLFSDFSSFLSVYSVSPCT